MRSADSFKLKSSSARRARAAARTRALINGQTCRYRERNINLCTRVSKLIRLQGNLEMDIVKNYYIRIVMEKLVRI